MAQRPFAERQRATRALWAHVACGNEEGVAASLKAGANPRAQRWRRGNVLEAAVSAYLHAPGIGTRLSLKYLLHAGGHRPAHLQTALARVLAFERRRPDALNGTTPAPLAEPAAVVVDLALAGAAWQRQCAPERFFELALEHAAEVSFWTPDEQPECQALWALVLSLVDAGVSVEHTTPGVIPYTPLMRALLADEEEAVLGFLRRGACTAVPETIQAIHPTALTAEAWARDLQYPHPHATRAFDRFAAEQAQAHLQMHLPDHDHEAAGGRRRL